MNILKSIRMVIVDARWETPKERESRISFQNTFDRKEESIKWCNENHQLLIKHHQEFSEKYPKELYDKELQVREERLIYINENNRMFEAIKEGLEAFCHCGGRIRYVTNYNFCGCENYRNKLIHHKTYNILPLDDESKIFIDIGKNYLNTFKKRYAIPSMVSIIYKTLVAHGVELLCEIEESYFNVARNSGFSSKTEEMMILEILKSKYKSVLHQQGIKIYDGKKWYVRIPDYICTEENSCHVYDAKKAMRNIDQKQLNEYTDAVRVIARRKNPEIDIKGNFILFDPEQNSNDELTQKRCFTIPMLRDL